MLFLATAQATRASVGPPAIFRHVAKAKASVAPIYLRFSAAPAGDPPDFEMVRLE